jgi:hypothetical protein
MDYFKQNNFDLIRLVAAAQVMLFHTMHYMAVPVGSLKTIVAYLPGVPALFPYWPGNCSSNRPCPG